MVIVSLKSALTFLAVLICFIFYSYNYFKSLGCRSFIDKEEGISYFGLGLWLAYG